MYNLYLVRHAIGTFIGVAEDMRVARKAWGEEAEIIPLSTRAVVDAAMSQTDKVFIAEA